MKLSVSLRKKVNGFTLDIQWEIGNESIVLLFGYSGAGKSMTLQLLAGLMEPDDGFIYLDGEVLFDSSKKINLPPQQRTFGYVFQDCALFPHMTVKENIAFGIKGLSRSEKERRVEEMIETFRLEDIQNKMPSEISGGQKQRVALARALMRRPELLLLDEPFSALDNPIRLEMRRLLKDIRERFNIPIILVTHDLIEAYTMADRIIIYSGGRVAQIGTPSEVFSAPATPEVARLVNTENILKPFGQSAHIYVDSANTKAGRFSIQDVC